MLMAVTERFREIGTMKCLGAPDRFIVRLFFTEAVLLGTMASFLGTALGFSVAVLQFAAVLEIDLPGLGAFFAAFAFGAPIVFVAGILLTVVAALYPSRIASRMKPAEAIRREV